MKSLLFVSVALAALALPAGAQNQTQNPKPGAVMYVTPAEAAKLTAKVMDGVSTYFVVPLKGTYGQELVYRVASGVPEVHRDWADHFVVVEGAAGIIVGGKVVGEKDTGPGEKRGTSIIGGKEYALTPGTSITIPPGVPHWTVLKPGAHFRAVVFKLKD